jgi:L-ascorbate metabolism protein UlaG (beta-lactamase superfamily)
MLVTFLGHSCFLVETKGYSLLFDPFISGNPLASSLSVEDIKADYILLSHGHLDHVLDAERIAENNQSTIVSNYEIATYYGNKGLKNHPMNHGGSFVFPFGRVKYTPAIHSSSLPDGSYGGNPGGFVVQNEEGTFYFSGDTSLDLNMQLIPKLFGAINFCILPIGSNFTMDVEEAVLAAEFLQCNTIVACHFDTFPPIAIKQQEALEKFEIANKKLHILSIGQTIEL